jgi:hypothetical protein
MIFWRGKSKKTFLPCRSSIRYRKVLELRPRSLTLKYENLTQAGHWVLTNTLIYQVCFYFQKLRFGFKHTWFEGPNCSFALGFIVFNWVNWNCIKCKIDFSKSK